MNVKNGRKDLERYPHISRRVRDTLARLLILYHPGFRGLNKRARVSLTLRLICGYLLRSLLPFLTCIYETLLDLEINKMRFSSVIVFFLKKYY